MLMSPLHIRLLELLVGVKPGLPERGCRLT